MGIDTQITDDPERYKAFKGAKINYSSDLPNDGLTIRPHGILFDHGVKDYALDLSGDDRFYKVFFKSGGDLTFDLFGAAFWLLTRYEEYLPHKGDRHNRFHYRSSLAWQAGFIERPLVNLWLSELLIELRKQTVELQVKPPRYQLLSSIDIDNAYKYRYKGLVRTLAGLVADRKPAAILRRLRILSGKEKDPFDCYDFLVDLHKREGVHAVYFFLLGDYGPNDKNHAATNLEFQSLIKHLGDYSMVGIHPSFGSNSSLHQLKVETNRLSNITHRTINRSRQHFGILRFPKTYQDLLQAGIVHDYSMGYPNCNGFRASWCCPYYWYNLEIESESALMLHPFCITDTTLYETAHETGHQLLHLAKPFVEEVKKYGGELIPIFHNDRFDEEMRSFYRELLRIAK